MSASPRDPLGPPDPEDPWIADDPGVFAGWPGESEPVADLTSTAITPAGWLLDHGPTVRYRQAGYGGRHRCDPWYRILKAARGRPLRGRRVFPWRDA